MEIIFRCLYFFMSSLWVHLSYGAIISVPTLTDLITNPPGFVWSCWMFAVLCSLFKAFLSIPIHNLCSFVITEYSSWPIGCMGVLIDVCFYVLSEKMLIVSSEFLTAWSCPVFSRWCVEVWPSCYVRSVWEVSCCRCVHFNI